MSCSTHIVFETFDDYSNMFYLSTEESAIRIAASTQEFQLNRHIRQNTESTLSPAPAACSAKGCPGGYFWKIFKLKAMSIVPVLSRGSTMMT